MSQHQLWYMIASLVSSSLRTGRFIFILPLGSLQVHQPQHGHQETPNLSYIDATDEEVDAELLSLLYPWSGESEGNWSGNTHNSHCPQPWSEPCCGAWPHSWCTGQHWGLGTSHHSASAGRFAVCRDKTWLWKLNGVDAGGMEWGWPGPLGSMCPSVMTWGINCQPSPRLTGLVLSWACLPTQLMPPDNIDMVSHLTQAQSFS